jgi:hypothetical protein
MRRLSSWVVDRIRAGKGDVPGILMNTKLKRLTGFGEIARHLLDPLPPAEIC